jgi:hypothetical protein
MIFDPQRGAKALIDMDACVRPLVDRLNDYAGTYAYWRKHLHIRLLAAQIREHGVVCEGAYRQAPSTVYRHRVTSPDFTGEIMVIQAARYDPVGDRGGEFEIMPWISKALSTEGTCEKQDQLAYPIDPAHFATFRPIDTIEGWHSVDWACFTRDGTIDLYIDITVHAHTPDDAEFSLRLAYDQYTPTPCGAMPRSSKP